LNFRFLYTSIQTALFLIIASSCFGQNSSLRCFTVIHTDSIPLGDSLLIYPPSVSIQSKTQPDLQIEYSFDNRSNLVVLKNTTGNDSIQICFRVFSIPYRPSYFLFDTLVRQNPLRPDYSHPGYEIKSEREWWYSPGINYSGNFTRGISTGNSQSLVLNSSLNLQLSGDLGDGFSILGAISDNQIPIQPDGNTRQIQEFDRLYIRLSKDKQHLTAGDFEIGKPSGYFMNYFKKNKGGLLETKHQLSPVWTLENKAAFAISKGKSNRLTLKTQNGNQGPYRLFGNNNEQFIILLAGSEKIWIDGELLQRGEDADYSIDYNLAELRFTSKRIITNVSRVIVEFDQNYTRSLSILQTSARKNNFQTYLNFYNEQDSKTPAVESDLDSLDKQILSMSGDNLQFAARSGITKAGSHFNINRIYYREYDTMVIINTQNVNYRILRFDPLADSTALQVNFSEVLPGSGQYILKQSTANGRVYEWIAPDPLSGKNRGNYEPVISLIAPRQQFMLSSGMTWQGTQNAHLSTEIAISSLDKNRLSALDDEDNLGVAFTILGAAPRFSVFDSLVTIHFTANYEFIQNQFTPINPYRSVEFARDWNISSQTGSTDHLPKMKLYTTVGKHVQLEYEQSRLIRSTGYNAEKHRVTGNWNDSLTRVQLHFDILKSEDQLESSAFYRPGISINRMLGRSWNINMKALRERNERTLMGPDTLSHTSFYYDLVEAGFKKESGNAFTIQLTARHRIDYIPDDNSFYKNSISDEVVLESNVQSESFGNASIKMSGKNIQYTDIRLDDSLGRIYFLGALDHQIGLFKNFLHLKNYYELQSGVEPRQEFVFEEKKPGEGNFIYIDFNKDGIRQIYEYVHAPGIDTARFIRIQLFNSEYVQIYQSSWNQFMSFDFKNIINDRKRFNRFIRAVSFESAFRFNSKVSRESEIQNRINPLYFLKNTSDLIAYNSFLQQSLYYNRAHPIYEFQFGYQQLGQQVLLTSGTDKKKLQNLLGRFRLTIFRNIDFNLEFLNKNDEKITQFYPDQNYEISSTGIKPGLIYRFSQNARFHIHMTLRNSKENIMQNEKAKIHEIEAGTAMYLFKKLSLRSTCKYLSIDYTGVRGSILEFTMLDGFKHGNNFNWDLQMDYKINSLLQLQVSYSGRKAASSDILHTGRMQLRASF
jgi:hypothetical protein